MFWGCLIKICTPFAPLVALGEQLPEARYDERMEVGISGDPLARPVQLRYHLYSFLIWGDPLPGSLPSVLPSQSVPPSLFFFKMNLFVLIVG